MFFPIQLIQIHPSQSQYFAKKAFFLVSIQVRISYI